jgi:hypothetical protein
MPAVSNPMSAITLPEDQKVRKVLASWPSVARIPLKLMSGCEDEVRLDVLTHLARCAFRQNADTSEYEWQEGLAGAIRFLYMPEVHLWAVLEEKITYYPKEFRSGLELAFLLKDIEIAKALIHAHEQSFGSKPNRFDRHPMFILCSEIYADRSGDICAKMDLAKTIGWSPDLKDKNGNTALHLCAQNGCMELDMFQQVAEYYARAGRLHEIVNQENAAGHTPLMLPMWGGDGVNHLTTSKINFMLDCGADPKRCSSVSGRNLLTDLASVSPYVPDAVSRNQYHDLLRRLFAMGMTLDEPDASGVSALDHARENTSFWCEVASIQGKDVSNPEALGVVSRL